MKKKKSSRHHKKSKAFIFSYKKIIILGSLFSLLLLFVFFQLKNFKFLGIAASSPQSGCVLVQGTYNFCSSQYVNPIQSAINYASQNGLSLVQVGPGTFYITNSTTISTPMKLMQVGVYVPSNINLQGSTDVNNPTIVSFSRESTAINLGVYAAGNASDFSVPLTQAQISYIQIDGAEKVTVGLWVGKANGINITHNSVSNTKSSGIILGYFAQTQQNGSTNQGTVYPFSGTSSNFNQVANNNVQNVGSDGIAVTGNYNNIQNNNVNGALTAGISNCITIFLNSSSDLIQNNTVANCETGIGIDGSYPLYNASTTSTVSQMQTQSALAGETSEIGFDRYITIQQNTIKNSNNGIVLWRNSNANVKGNTITNSQLNSNSVGIFFNETESSYMVGNNISSAGTAIELAGNGYSPNGARYNGIGVFPVGNQWPIWSNTIANSANGILFVGQHVISNTVRGNNISVSGNPCNYFSGLFTIATNNIPSICNNL